MTSGLFDASARAALIETAHAAADAARGPCLAYFRTGSLVAEDKPGARPGFDPVTAADRGSEAAIRAVLAARRPADAILGEEGGTQAGTSGLTWVVDPIDGTRSFISGTPTWGVLIALNDGTRPVLGLIDQPFTGERFEGLAFDDTPGATWRRGAETRVLRTRRCARLADATLFTTFPEIGTPAEHAAFASVRGRVRLTRYGLDCYAYALVAMGCIDLVIEAGLEPYDVQALIPVIEGAGGRMTDWQGGSCAQGGRVLAAGDARVHDAALALLARCAG